MEYIVYAVASYIAYLYHYGDNGFTPQSFVMALLFGWINIPFAVLSLVLRAFFSFIGWLFRGL